MGDLGTIPKSGRSLEKGIATQSSIIAWRIPWTEEPGGLQSMGSQSQTQLSFLFCLWNVYLSSKPAFTLLQLTLKFFPLPSQGSTFGSLLQELTADLAQNHLLVPQIFIQQRDPTYSSNRFCMSMSLFPCPMCC